MSITKKVVAEVTKETKATSAKAKKESANEKFASAAIMEGKTERAESELSKAYKRAEVAAMEMFNRDCLSEVQKMIATRIELALIQERDKFANKDKANESNSFVSEIRTLNAIITKGKEETKGFTIKFSDTENGMTETPATDLHTMFAAAKQSMLKVKIAEREEKAAAAAAEEARKLEVMQSIGITPEQLAALKAAGVIK